MNVHTLKSSVSARFISPCIAGAFAALAAAWTPAALADSSGQYRLSPGDKINLVVLGQSELSGDFVIDGDGTIQLPLTGPIKVADLTVTECRERIYKLLSDGILSKPAMAVRIGEMRPIYVLGDVRSPGAYPYRYSTTVKSALAAAGDEPAPVLQPVLFGEYLQAEQRVRELQSQRLGLLVRAGRLEAERQGKITFVLPISGDVNERAEMIEMIKEEREALKASAEDRQSQIEALQAQKARYKESLAALEGELALVKKRAALAREKTDMYEEVERRGYGRRLTMIDASLAESGHAGDQWRLRSEMASRNAQMAEIDAKMSELQSAHRKQVRAEIYEVRQRLREVEAALPTARELRDTKLALARGSLAERAPRFSITRTRNGSTSVFQATDTTLIEAGDVIEVKRSLPFTRQLQEAKVEGRDFGHHVSWLQERPSKLRTQTADADNAVIGFKTKNDIINSGGKLIHSQQIAEISTQLTQARSNLSDVSARLERARAVAHEWATSSINPAMPETLNDALTNKLLQQYLELSNREAEYSERFGADHKATQKLHQRLEETKSGLIDGMERLSQSLLSEQSILKKRVQDLEASLAAAVANAHIRTSIRETARAAERREILSRQ